MKVYVRISMIQQTLVSTSDFLGRSAITYNRLKTKSVTRRQLVQSDGLF